MHNDTSPEDEGWDEGWDDGLRFAHGCLVALLITAIVLIAISRF